MTCDFVTGPMQGEKTRKGDFIIPMTWICVKCGKIVHSTVNVEVPFSWKKCEKDKDVKA